MTQKALLQSAGDGSVVPAGYVGEQLVATWTGQTITTSFTTLGTISLVNPGSYLVIIETDVSTVGASTTRIVSSITGSATFTITRISEGGDYALAVQNNAAVLYATYYCEVTSSGNISFLSRSINQNSTGSRGSFSLVRIA